MASPGSAGRWARGCGTRFVLPGFSVVRYRYVLLCEGGFLGGTALSGDAGADIDTICCFYGCLKQKKLYIPELI